MSTYLSNNVTSIRTINNYNNSTTAMNKRLTNITTGQKINSAKDNAASWAITEKMRDQIRANNQANQNVQNDSALLKTAQDGLGNTESILTTIKERAISAANDSNTNQDRAKIAEEIRQLVAQIDDNAAKVKFNGRQLLNGAQEGGTVSKTSGSSAVGVTASEPKGNEAVYDITSLKKWDGTNNKYVDAATGDKLTDLRDANGSGGQLFQEGDVITLSWLNNGEAKSASITVTDSAKLSDLVSAITYADGHLDSTDTGIKTANASLSNAKTADNKDVHIDNGGLYLVGDVGRLITDVSVSVTNSAGVAKTRAEEVLQPTAIQQANGLSATVDPSTHGSNAVYKLGDVVGDDGNKTSWMNLKSSTNYVYDNTAASDTEFKITIGDKTVTLLGRETIEDLNKKFEEAGINVRAQIATSANEELTYDGEKVIKGDSNSSDTYKAAAAGLYFIGAKGEAITSIKIDGGTSNNVVAITNFDTQASATLFTKSLSVDSSWIDGSTSSGAAGGSSLLPQGQTLQFFVGGEANFGINFSIGKATVANLFGSSADAFANKFTTKEGAESALATIDSALNKILTEQTRIGAMEARLGYTSDNLTSMNENLEASYSAERDADIAKEMTHYTLNAVRTQAAQYMLAFMNQNAYSINALLQP